MASPKLDNDTIPSVTKHLTQQTIDQFESCGILDRQNIHNNPELAAKRLGTTYAIASGRMSITYASEGAFPRCRSQGFEPQKELGIWLTQT